MSRGNFAKNLLAQLISEEEWLTHNVHGKRGKQQIDSTIINYVKECTFCAYPKDVGEDTKVAWDVCVRAMDAGGRGLVKKKKV